MMENTNVQFTQNTLFDGDSFDNRHLQNVELMGDKEVESKLFGSKFDELLLGSPKDELPRIGIENAEIVRRQYLSHVKEAVLTIRPNCIAFNNSCISKMIDTHYIQILIDRDKKRLIIRACDENDKDGQKWCKEKNGKRISRNITGRPFCNKLYEMMGWCKAYYYKICGSPAVQIDNEDELLFVFELEETERFTLTSKARKKIGISDDEINADLLKTLNEEEAEKTRQLIEQGKKIQLSKEKYPETWKDEGFGPKVDAHENKVYIPRLSDFDSTFDDDPQANG